MKRRLGSGRISLLDGFKPMIRNRERKPLGLSDASNVRASDFLSSPAVPAKCREKFLKRQRILGLPTGAITYPDLLDSIIERICPPFEYR